MDKVFFKLIFFCLFSISNFSHALFDGDLIQIINGKVNTSQGISFEGGWTYKYSNYSRDNGVLFFSIEPGLYAHKAHIGFGSVGTKDWRYQLRGSLTYLTVKDDISTFSKGENYYGIDLVAGVYMFLVNAGLFVSEEEQDIRLNLGIGLGF